MDLTRPSAYHGHGWRPRSGTLSDDLQSGVHRGPFGVNSDSATLTDVVLFTPAEPVVQAADPQTLQHLRPLNATRLAEDIGRLADTYERLGIRVHPLPPPRPERMNLLAGANAMYARDLLWMTPQGAVISRMASEARAGEEDQALRLCANLGIPIVRTIGGNGLFEGADALWLRPDLLAVGIGHRTNASGAEQVTGIAHQVGTAVVELHVPDGIQHLLGAVQVVAEGVAAVRTGIFDPNDVVRLQRAGVDVLPVAESDEVRNGFAFNMVCLAPNRIVMVDGAPRTRGLFSDLGIECAATVAVPELLAGAGGIGCATGILGRGGTAAVMA